MKNTPLMGGVCGSVRTFKFILPATEAKRERKGERKKLYVDITPGELT